MEILDKILGELKRKGFSQKELADYLELSPNNITDWKSGRSRSYTKYLPQIAKFLNVSVDYLVENEIKKEPGNELFATGCKVIIKDPTLKAIYDKLSGLSPRELEIAEAQLDLLLQLQAREIQDKRDRRDK